MTEEDKCRVVSVADVNIFSPILVNFEFGFNSNVDASKLKCDLYIDSDKKEDKTVVIEKDDKKFVGKVPSKKLCKTLLLVRNRKTNEARVFVTQFCNLVDSSREEENLKRKRPDVEIETQSPLDRERDLRLSFGSKKAKRAINVNMKLNKDLETDVKGLQEAVSDISVKVADVNISNKSDDDVMKLLPPCNRKASRQQDVYKVEDILTQEELDSLLPGAEFLVNNSLAEMDEKKSFFLYSHYKLLGPDPDINKIALLIYAASLINFYNLRANDMRNKSCMQRICPQSQKIGAKILNEFTVTVNNIRTRPNFCKDKIVCFVIILILISCNFKVDMDKLAGSFKGFGQKKLMKLARIVGLRKSKASQQFYLMLPLPPLPQIRSLKKNS